MISKVKRRDTITSLMGDHNQERIRDPSCRSLLFMLAVVKTSACHKMSLPNPRFTDAGV